MKAIFEMDAPESCEECRFVCDVLGNEFFCAASQVVGKYYTVRRRPDCPLIIKDADMCMSSEKNQFYEEMEEGVKNENNN